MFPFTAQYAHIKIDVKKWSTDKLWGRSDVLKSWVCDFSEKPRSTFPITFCKLILKHTHTHSKHKHQQEETTKDRKPQKVELQRQKERHADCCICTSSGRLGCSEAPFFVEEFIKIQVQISLALFYIH